jgi:tRNA pseudouridine13 synthase
MSEPTTNTAPATVPATETNVTANSVSGQTSTAPAHDLVSITNAAEKAQREQEHAVGITAYVSPEAPGFSCIVKQRYTDFLVNEIATNGQVLHLTEIAEPAKKQSREQKRANATAGAEANGENGLRARSPKTAARASDRK